MDTSYMDAVKRAIRIAKQTNSERLVIWEAGAYAVCTLDEAETYYAGCEVCYSTDD